MNSVTWGGGGSASSYLQLQYVKADGVTTTGVAMLGTAGVVGTGLISGIVSPTASAPSDAYYLRVRIGLQRGTTPAGDGAVIDIVHVRVERSAQMLLFPDSLTPASTGPGIIYQNAGTIYIIPGPTSDGFPIQPAWRGTFTPALSYATPGTSSWATTFALGWWTLTGNVVNYTLFYSGVPTNGTAAGNLNLTGLPFTSKATTNEHHEGATSMSGWTKASYTMVTMQVQQGGTVAQFQASGSGQAISPLAVADIPSGGTVIVRASGIYMTA